MVLVWAERTDEELRPKVRGFSGESAQRRSFYKRLCQCEGRNTGCLGVTNESPSYRGYLVQTTSADPSKGSRCNYLRCLSESSQGRLPPLTPVRAASGAMPDLGVKMGTAVTGPGLGANERRIYCSRGSLLSGRRGSATLLDHLSRPRKRRDKKER